MADDGPRTVGGKIVLRIYLLDNSFKTLLVDPDATIKDVILAVSSKIGFQNPADDSLNFSLHQCKDGVTIERALTDDTRAVVIMDSWPAGSKAKFVFQCKLFTESVLKSQDPKIIYMMYIQSVYYVITGTYPTVSDEAAQLGALQFHVKFGKHNPASHRPGFLKTALLEYIPGPHLASNAMPQEEWERLLFQKHSQINTTQPMQEYLNILTKRPYFGATMFGVKQEYTRTMPKRLLLGVVRTGVMLLRPPSKPTMEDMHTLQSYSLSDIYRWAYKPGINFYFETKAEDVDDGVTPVYSFSTTEGKHISDMLTDYAMGMLREMGLNPDGTRREAAPKPEVDTAAQEAAERAKAQIASSGVDNTPVAEPEPAASATEEEPDAAYDAYASGTYQGEGYDEAGYAIGGEEGAYDTGAGAAGTELPADWTEVYDEGSGAYYYFNTATGESSWEPPTE